MPPRAAAPGTFRRLLDRADERSLLPEADPVVVREVNAALLREDESRVIAVGWMGIPIFLLLLQVDLGRIRTGVFDQDPFHVWLFLLHLLVGLSALPAIRMDWLRRRGFPRSRALALAHVAPICAANLGMGLIGMAQRQSVFELTLALILLNLIYQIPAGVRIGATLLSTAGALWILSAQWGLGSPVTDVIRLNEILVVALVMSFVGNTIHRQRIRSLLAEAQLDRLARTDALTGAASRGEGERILREAVEVAARSGRVAPAVLLFDADHFKKVNDTHGHAAGDGVLRRMASIAVECARASDVVVRWGGEEFLVICSGTNVGGARELAERIRSGIEAGDFGEAGPRTASFGVAVGRPGESVDLLVHRADQALYRAKHGGRNRVEIAS